MEPNNRKSIRTYTSDPIDDALLHRLLSEAMRAPTMGNMQLYSVVVTKDAERKRQLSPLHFGQPMVENAAVVITFCADFHRFTRWCQLRQADAGYDNFLSFLNAVQDTLLLTQTFITLAEREGLGTCYLGTTVYNPLGLIDLLQLPELTFPVATITVGWPAEDPPLTDRLPVGGLVHEESYKDLSDKEINDLYFEKESLEENRNYVQLNGKENLAQVFTDCRYTRKDNEALTAGLLEALKHQHFL